MIAIFIVAAVAIFGGVIGTVLYVTRKKPLGTPGFAPTDLLFAIADVWTDTYDMKYSDLPKFTWVTGKQLNCFTGRGWKSGDICVAGMSWIERNECAIAWPEGSKFSDTAFAHELLHAARWHNQSLPLDHNSQEFIDLVAKANATLMAGKL